MKLSFRTRKLQESLTTDKGLATSYGTRAKKIKLRIQQLESAEDLSAIAKLPFMRLHQHSGDAKGTWSVDIQENWRILFTLDQDPVPVSPDGGIKIIEIIAIRIESIEDPH